MVEDISGYEESVGTDMVHVVTVSEVSDIRESLAWPLLSAYRVSDERASQCGWTV